MGGGGTSFLHEVSASYTEPKATINDLRHGSNIVPFHVSFAYNPVGVLYKDILRPMAVGGCLTKSSPTAIFIRQLVQRIEFHQPRYRTSFAKMIGYLLFESLSGLGRTLSLWMLEHGARYFAFMGVAQIPVLKGDVHLFEDVQRTVKSIKLPVAGVTHAASLYVFNFIFSMLIDNVLSQELLFDMTLD
jgi:hypothetical protein